MSRYELYEEKEKMKMSTLLMIVFFVIVMLVALGFYLSPPQKADKQQEFTEIALPAEKIKPNLADKKLLPDSAKKDVGDSNANKPRELTENLIPEIPLLINSDEQFRVGLTNVSAELNNWFSTTSIIRKFIVLINDLSQNQIVYKHRKFLKMPQKIVVHQDALGLFMAEESYKRYDDLIDTIVAIDITKGLDLYKRFKPLFQQVYTEFGYPEEYRLDDIFLKAAASVINAPVKNGRIALIQHALRYKFADKKIEALNAVEKQMIRMGSKNTQKIQTKLRQIVEKMTDLNE